MSTQVNDGLQVNAPRAVDMRSGKIVSNKLVPYSSIEEALASEQLNPLYRHEGLEFMVKTDTNITKYRFTANYLDGEVQEIIGVERVTTFADISISTEKRMIDVAEDETNDGEPTLYYHNGTTLNWIVTQEA